MRCVLGQTVNQASAKRGSAEASGYGENTDLLISVHEVPLKTLTGDEHRIDGIDHPITQPKDA
jgi:hypothetical protein